MFVYCVFYIFLIILLRFSAMTLSISQLQALELLSGRQYCLSGHPRKWPRSYQQSCQIGIGPQHHAHMSRISMESIMQKYRDQFRAEFSKHLNKNCVDNTIRDQQLMPPDHAKRTTDGSTTSSEPAATPATPVWRSSGPGHCAASI